MSVRIVPGGEEKCTRPVQAHGGRYCIMNSRNYQVDGGVAVEPVHGCWTFPTPLGLPLSAVHERHMIAADMGCKMLPG